VKESHLHNLHITSGSLETRINLLVDKSRAVLIQIPVLAVGLDKVKILRVLDLLGQLEELHRQTLRHVPRDVAVEGPHARVGARLEGDHEPAEAGKHGGVAAEGLVEVELLHVGLRVEEAGAGEGGGGRDGV